IEAMTPVYNSEGLIESVDYTNSDVRNTGIELSVNMRHNDNWNTSWGVMYNRPQARNYDEYGDNEWHDYYGKYQLKGSINYKKGKFAGSLDGNFVGNRTRQNHYQQHMKPQFFTNLHLTYKPEENHKIFFHMNNIFDRLDITSNSTSNYYSL
ncbi:MAG: TonB-dependent receptor, partial [Acidaminococcaceae bacterium]|nr:TonB-dependent receptor [Acidaminococcaceae bacterium]